MSLIDTPMALLDRVLGRRGLPPDDPIVRRIERVMPRLEPDPLFERRLRSAVVNQYVAAREGLARPQTRRDMGRLGRAVLYASLGVALTATAAGAAAHEALPGDFLYAAKLRLEEIRIQIAPAAVRPELAALAADERLDELETLAAAGEWARVSAAAPGVEAAVERLAAIGLAQDAPQLLAIGQHVAVLEALLADAPAAAQAGLQQALEASSSAGSPPEAGTHGSPADPERRQPEQRPLKSTKPARSPGPTPSPASAVDPPPTASHGQDGEDDGGDQATGGQNGAGGPGGTGGTGGTGGGGGGQDAGSTGGPPQDRRQPSTGP